MVIGIAVMAANALAGGWGGIAWYQRRPSVTFWYLLRTAQVTVAIQAALGFALLADGREPAEGLHIVYGLLPLAVAFFAEATRAGVAQRELGDLDVHSLAEERQHALAMEIVRRETGIMAASALVIVALALRAYLLAV